MKTALEAGSLILVDYSLVRHLVQQSADFLVLEQEFFLGCALGLRVLAKIADRVPEAAPFRNIALTADFVGLHTLLGRLVVRHREPSLTLTPCWATNTTQ